MLSLVSLSSRSTDSPLPPLPIQYADFAVWQRDWLQGNALSEQLAWWKRRLADMPVQLALPTDRPRPVSLSSLSREQVGALIYHLLYWNGPVNADLRTALDLGRLPVRPQFPTRGCLYDY